MRKGQAGISWHYFFGVGVVADPALMVDDRGKAICRKASELSLILPLWWTIAVMPMLRSGAELLAILPLWWTIAVMLHRCGRLRSIEWFPFCLRLAARR